MAAKATNSSNYPSVSWADTLDMQQSALRWDVKRAMKSLCSKLEEIGEECFVVTVNVSNGWVGHLGTIRGDEYINAKSHILYDFLNYCAESLRDDECEDDANNNSSDVESNDADVNEENQSDPEADRPIQISRPSPSHDETDELDQGDPVIVQKPKRYESSQLKRIPVPPDLSQNNFILLNPIELPFVTQNVVMATNIPTEQLSSETQSDKTENSTRSQTPTDQPVGGKRKRKQSFEGIARYSREQQLDNTARMTGGHDTKETDPVQEIQVNKSTRKETKRKSVTEEKIAQPEVRPATKSACSLGDKEKEEDTDSSGSGNELDVCESDRVLRSRQGKQRNWKTLLKPVESDDVDEEKEWNDDDFEVDDKNDEDWAEDIEERDRFGRFLPCVSSSKKRKIKMNK